MKKILSLFLAAAMVLSMTACGGKKGEDNKTYEIALLANKGSVADELFCKSAWEGVVEFAGANGQTHKYYEPEQGGSIANVDQAVDAGAKIVVAPGKAFEVAIYEAQTKYPDVKFILLDGAPHTADNTSYKTGANVSSVMYSEEQSGYLAGYAAVKDGFTKLGFMGGMALPTVQAFGYGFLQGAEAAAKESRVNVNVKYHYTGNAEASDSNEATAASMYKDGTEVIFACGGGVGISVMTAAEKAGKYVIGVDVDQSSQSTTVITSAAKGLRASVVQVLNSIYNSNDFDKKYGGMTTTFDARYSGVNLPLDFSRFPNSKFTQEEYQSIYQKLVDGSAKPIRSINIASGKYEATAGEMTSQLKLSRVKVKIVN